MQINEGEQARMEKIKKKHMDNTSEKWMNELIRIRLLRGLKGKHRRRTKPSTKNKLLETSH